MYRVVVLTTLVLLLLAVAGVSVAREGRIFSESNRDGIPGSTMPERTSFEATGPEDTTTSQPPGASSGTDDRQDVPEPTVVTEPTPGTNDVGKPGHVGKAPDLGRYRDEVVPHGNGGPGVHPQKRVPGRGPGPTGKATGVEAPRNGKGGGGRRDKVVLCHKNKTLTVGAPARAAHLRHGDSPGACR